MDHLGTPTMDISSSIRNYKKSVGEVGTCNVPYPLDPRTHLNGPFVSLRKVQKQLEGARLQTVELRRCKLKGLLEGDRREYMKELLEQGMTLYSDALL